METERPVLLADGRMVTDFTDVSDLDLADSFGKHMSLVSGIVRLVDLSFDAQSSNEGLGIPAVLYEAEEKRGMIDAIVAEMDSRLRKETGGAA